MTIDNSVLYSASYDVANGLAAGRKHVYLIYDPNTDYDFNPSTFDDSNLSAIPRIIRGGPEGGEDQGRIEIEAGRLINQSEDRFDLDRTGDDLPDTLEERNVTAIFTGAEATQRMTQFEATARELSTSEFDPNRNVGYSTTDYYFLGDPASAENDSFFFGANSNSTINSVFTHNNLNTFEYLPETGGVILPGVLDEYPGINTVLDTNGISNYTLSGERNYSFIDDGNAADNIHLTDGASLTVFGSQSLATQNRITIESTDNQLRFFDDGDNIQFYSLYEGVQKTYLTFSDTFSNTLNYITTGISSISFSNPFSSNDTTSYNLYDNSSFSSTFSSMGYSSSFLSDFSTSGWDAFGSSSSTSSYSDYSFDFGGSDFTAFGQNDRLSVPTFQSNNDSSYWGSNRQIGNYGIADSFDRWSQRIINAWNHVSPLSFDLDGDGIESSHIYDQNVFFDIDGDGFAEKVGWINADDGQLAIDTNGDGIINDITELFGDDIMPANDNEMNLKIAA